MGAPVNTGIENFEEVILGLSKADRVKLLGWIAESLVEEENSPPAEEDGESDEASPKEDIEWPPKNLPQVERLENEASWLSKINPPTPDLTDEEWKERVSSVAGLWSDLPDDYGDDIVSSRTVSTREINLND